MTAVNLSFSTSGPPRRTARCDPRHTPPAPAGGDLPIVARCALDAVTICARVRRSGLLRRRRSRPPLRAYSSPPRAWKQCRSPPRRTRRAAQKIMIPCPHHPTRPLAAGQSLVHSRSFGPHQHDPRVRRSPAAGPAPRYSGGQSLVEARAHPSPTQSPPPLGSTPPPAPPRTLPPHSGTAINPPPRGSPHRSRESARLCDSQEAQPVQLSTYASDASSSAIALSCGPYRLRRRDRLRQRHLRGVRLGSAPDRSPLPQRHRRLDQVSTSFWRIAAHRRHRSRADEPCGRGRRPARAARVPGWT